MITFDWPRRKHNDAAIHAAAAPGLTQRDLQARDRQT
jgi:hypothetical protein